METEEINKLKEVLNTNVDQLEQNQKNLLEISNYFQSLYTNPQVSIDYNTTSTQAKQYVIQGLNLILYQINFLTKGVTDYILYQSSIADSLEFEINSINQVNINRKYK